MRVLAVACAMTAVVLVPTEAHAIVGGTVATPAPWGAQVYTDEPGRTADGFVCSGTIIAPRWVLTARHCVDPDDEMRVRVGDDRFGAGTEVRVDEKIYGWGRETPGGPPAPRLKVAEVTVLPTDGRTDMFGGRALINEGRTGAAMPGDSGGPQFHEGEQVGVASMLDHNGSDPNGTIVYSSIAAHRDWIRSTAGV